MKKAVILSVFLGTWGPGAVLAQPVFKCLEGRSITYSSTPCEDLGLRPGGEIKDRVTTVPSVKRPASATALPQKPTSARPENDVDLPRPPTVKPVNPLIEKLAK